jgi:hypothetical protein
MADPVAEREWRSLIERLTCGTEPEPPPASLAPFYEEATARNRVGLLITKAVLGDEVYELYRINCGEPTPPR